MSRTQTQLSAAAPPTYNTPDRRSRVSHQVPVPNASLPSLPSHTTLPLVSAAALFLSNRYTSRRKAARPAHSTLALPLAHRLKTSSRRFRSSARRLSVRCKHQLSFIVAALHSATLHRCLRLSFAPDPAHPHDHPVCVARPAAPLPPALPSSRTMCQSPISHEERLVARFDPTSAPPPCEDIPTSPKCDDPPSPTCFSEPESLISRTLTLYDWDDTFFPSTFLAARGVRIDENDQLPQSVLDELEELEAIVIKILQEALRCGVVKVITNAEEGWVELSGSRFMPKLTDFLKANQIKIVSARTIYEAEFPDSPSCWKTAAFAAEVDESYPDADELNVLVLGDSLSEREAAHNLASRKPTSYVKSVKLVERPNVTQLRRQIALLHGSFRELREHYGSFDVNLTC